jgi:hypothetical protein
MKTYKLVRYGIGQILDKNAREIADDISLYVQKQGGQFSIHRHHVNFYIPDEYSLFLKIMYPFLEEVSYIY